MSASEHPLPPTRWSLVVVAAGRRDEPGTQAALEEMCRLYWTPLYAFARRWGAPVDAAPDLVQAFFSGFIERGDLNRVQPEKGRFRAFLLTAFQNFLITESRRERAQKRGGGVSFVSTEEAHREEEWHGNASSSLGPEEAFDRRWAENVMSRALARLEEDYRRAGQTEAFTILRGAVAGGPLDDTATLARRLGLTPGGAGSAVHRLRARFRDALLGEVRDTVLASSDADGELRYLLTLLAR